MGERVTKNGSRGHRLTPSPKARPRPTGTRPRPTGTQSQTPSDWHNEDASHAYRTGQTKPLDEIFRPS
jgi:hypothetical protein